MKEMLRNHLRDNSGDENITKLIWISIAFIVGAILLALLTQAFKGPITRWFQSKISQWFNENNGLIDGTDDALTPGTLIS